MNQFIQWSISRIKIFLQRILSFQSPSSNSLFQLLLSSRRHNTLAFAQATTKRGAFRTTGRDRVTFLWTIAFVFVCFGCQLCDICVRNGVFFLIEKKQIKFNSHFFKNKKKVIQLSINISTWFRQSRRWLFHHNHNTRTTTPALTNYRSQLIIDDIRVFGTRGRRGNAFIDDWFDITLQQQRFFRSSETTRLLFFFKKNENLKFDWITRKTYSIDGAIIKFNLFAFAKRISTGHMC